MDEEKVYTILIWALAIGIVIVVATLIITRPPEETFTEIYFNNHTALPEYLNNKDNVTYSFTIANHENEGKQYEINITNTLYAFDYSCEESTIYLDESQSNYEKFTQPSNIPTRRATTTDPTLYIKAENYSIEYTYNVKSGAGQIITEITDINNNPAYTVIINEKSGNAFILSGNTAKTQKITLKERMPHKVRIAVKKNKVTLSIDNKEILSQKVKNTKGFPVLETTNTYAKISGLTITRNTEKQYVSTRFGGIQYVTIPIELTQTLRQTIVTYQSPDATGILPNITLPKNTVYIYEATPINLTSYTMQTMFRNTNGTDFALGIAGAYELQYSKNSAIANFTHGNKTTKIKFEPANTAWHHAAIEFNEGNARIYIDYKLIKEISNITPINGSPYIKTRDPGILLRNFYVESNTQPITFAYKLPVQQQEKSTTFYDYQLIDPQPGAPETQTTTENAFENNKIDWEVYRAEIIYAVQEPNASMNILFNDLESTIYSISITGKTAQATYVKQGEAVTKTSEIQGSTQAYITQIDVENNNIKIRINGATILEDAADKTTNGVLLLNHTAGIYVTKTEIEDLQGTEIRSYERSGPKCEPIIISQESKQWITYINDEESATMTETFIPEKEFDIAKVEVSTDKDHNIYFLVRQQ